MTVSSTTIDSTRTGRLSRRATRGASARTSIPAATGPITIRKTCCSLSTCSPREALPGRKYPAERFTTIGSVTTISTELIAVSVTFSATFPPNRWLNRLAVGPPGDAATTIRPTASSGGSRKAITSPKQAAGSTTS